MMCERRTNLYWRELAPIILVVLAALVLRTVYLLQYRIHIPYFYHVTLDSAYYDAWAQRVAEGKGYRPMPFYMAPLYPYFLALIYKIAGHNYLIVYLIQAALGTINTTLVYIIGRKVFCRAVGLIAASLLLLYSPLMYLESKLLTEVLAITLNLISIILLMHAVERPSAAWFLASGLALGISAVCRPAALIMALLVTLWILVRNKGKTLKSYYCIPLLVVGVVLPIIPVAARNYFIGKDFALISTNAGIVFAQGNSEYASGISTPLPGFSGTILTQQQEEMAQAANALGRQVKPSESSAYWFKFAISFISKHPAEYLKLLCRKAIWSLHNRESPCSYNVYYEREYVPILRWLAMPFPFLAGLALFGLIRFRSKKATILLLYILSIFLSLMVFSVSSRYRAPMVPGLVIFSACGLLEAINFVRQRDIPATAFAILCIALMFLPSLVRFPTPAVTAEAPTNMGWSYMEQGKVDEAIVQFKKALQMNPNFSHAHNNLGIALARQGKVDQAIAEYEKALSLTPDYPEAHFNLGDALVSKGKLDEAIAHYQASIRLRPDYAPTHVHLGNAFLLKNLYDKAIAEYQEALRLDPDVPDARNNLEVALTAKERFEGSAGESKQKLATEHYNRANGLLREGKFEEAVAEYRNALAIDPKFGRAHNNLAVTLFMIGQYEEAWHEVKLARKYGAEPNPNFIRGLSEKMPEP